MLQSKKNKEDEPAKKSKKFSISWISLSRRHRKKKSFEEKVEKSEKMVGVDARGITGRMTIDEAAVLLTEGDDADDSPTLSVGASESFIKAREEIATQVVKEESGNGKGKAQEKKARQERMEKYRRQRKSGTSRSAPRRRGTWWIETASSTMMI